MLDTRANKYYKITEYTLTCKLYNRMTKYSICNEYDYVNPLGINHFSRYLSSIPLSYISHHFFNSFYCPVFQTQLRIIDGSLLSYLPIFSATYYNEKHCISIYTQENSPKVAILDYINDNIQNLYTNTQSAKQSTL